MAISNRWHVMRRIKRGLLSALLCVMFANEAVRADTSPVIISDEDLTLTEGEFRYIYQTAAPQIRSQMESNSISRYEVIATAIANKRILKNLQAAGASDPELYYALQLELLGTARKFDEKRFQADLVLPNLEELARERYRISKQEIAERPEYRSVSHILLLCSDGCDQDAKRAELQSIRERLDDGESFSDLALATSQDPGSRQRGGRLSRSISLEDENVDQTFRQTAFSLEKVGDISGIVQSRFGFHVMRLDGIEPARVYTFEEVKEPLVAEIEKRFREDAYRDYLLSQGPSDALVIDGDAIDAILGPLPEAPLP